jgi:4,5-dihydroxyphthalate decarboxylase
VFPDGDAAADAFWQRHRLVPVNHMLSVRQDLAARRPDLVLELVRMFGAAAEFASQAPSSGQAALSPAIELALRYMRDQDMLPRPLTLDKVWDGLPDEVI